MARKNEVKKSSDNKKDNKSKKGQKPGIWDRIKNFFKSMTSELKRVVWPDKKTTTQTTIVVIVIVALVAILVFAIDSIMTLILNALGFNTAPVELEDTVQTTIAQEVEEEEEEPEQTTIVTTTGDVE